MADDFHILFVFIDGLGLGPPTSVNPLAERYAGLERMSGGRAWTAECPVTTEPSRVWRPIDANLGVEGLPQSGTGQASLFTGENCALLAGRHYGPYPHSATRQTIAARNIFTRVKQRFPHEHEPAAFANAYPDRFFTYARKRDWWTVTTRCCLDAGIPIRTAEQLRRGRAISADITGAGWPQAIPEIDVITEERAAERLLEIARSHRFTLFEYYLTDKAGHSRDDKRARSVLSSVDRLVGALVEMSDASTDLLIITSDHGNMEDLDTKSHTRNPVPLAVMGAGAAEFGEVTDLTGVVPALMQVFSRPTV